MIFIDRSVPRGVADAIMKVRDDVMWLEPLFPHNTKEVNWLPVAGDQGWLTILRDKKIRTRPGERQAIISHRVGAFVLAQRSDPTRWGYLKLLVKTLDQMEALFTNTPRPFIFMIDRDGGFTQYDLSRFVSRGGES